MTKLSFHLSDPKSLTEHKTDRQIFGYFMPSWDADNEAIGGPAPINIRSRPIEIALLGRAKLELKF